MGWDERRQQAADWLARLNSRSVSTEELQEFYSWRQHPTNAEAYGQVERLWNDSRSLGGDRDVAGAVKAALERPQQRTGLLEGLSRRTMFGGGALAIAAAVLGFLLINRPTQYVTGTGEQRLITLDDGSRMRLNTDTEVAVEYAEGQREVELNRGQAFFEVRADPHRPFFVRSGSFVVRTLGTDFDVRKDNGDLRVTLVHGAVLVSDDRRPDGGSRLAPGDAYVLEHGETAQIHKTDVELATSWLSGRMVFKDTPLGAAVAEANRYSRRKIELRSATLSELKVDGSFEAGDTDAFVAALAALFPLRSQATPEGNIILTAIPR
jgi:transmembrane sensor